jgi:hypothetical protein
MPTDADYEAMIQEYDDWDKLKAFWAKIKNKKTPGWPPGKAFEYLVLQAFNLDQGCIRWPYKVTLDDEVIEQIDGFVHIGRLSCIIESKDTASAVTIEPIAKMRNQLLRRHSGAIGLVFSSARFTDAALVLAKYIAPQAILLWTGREMDQVMSDKKIHEHLEYKYRACVETGMTDASIQESSIPG